MTAHDTLAIFIDYNCIPNPDSVSEAIGFLNND